MKPLLEFVRDIGALLTGVLVLNFVGSQIIRWMDRRGDGTLHARAEKAK